MNKLYDMIVIGGGPAGYTAALYAARAGLKVVVLEKLSAGGQMAQTTQVDNYPGFADGVDGFLLGQDMQKQAHRFGTETELADVLSVSLTGMIKEVNTTEGVFHGKTVVIATGANPRKLNIPKEDLFTGRGVHYCAACDGYAYKGKTVVVVGGGNSAAADALLLSRVAEKVIVVHRRDTLRATKIYHEPLMQAPNVQFLWNSTLSELLCEDRITGVRVQNINTGKQTEYACSGVFISIGRAPASDMVAQQLTLDNNGYIVANESTQTNIAGVFAAGDVRTKALRQIVTAVADGAAAAHHAEQYLAQL